MLVDGAFVGFGGQLDEEVAGIHGEKGGEEGGVGDLAPVDTVAVAARAGVDADTAAFRGGEAGENSGGGRIRSGEGFGALGVGGEWSWEEAGEESRAHLLFRSTKVCRRFAEDRHLSRGFEDPTLRRGGLKMEC